MFVFGGLAVLKGLAVYVGIVKSLALKGELKHIKVCLQVLGSMTSYVKSNKLYKTFLWLWLI